MPIFKEIFDALKGFEVKSQDGLDIAIKLQRQPNAAEFLADICLCLGINRRDAKINKTQWIDLKKILTEKIEIFNKKEAGKALVNGVGDIQVDINSDSDKTKLVGDARTALINIKKDLVKLDAWIVKHQTNVTQAKKKYDLTDQGLKKAKIACEDASQAYQKVTFFDSAKGAALEKQRKTQAAYEHALSLHETSDRELELAKIALDRVEAEHNLIVKAMGIAEEAFKCQRFDVVMEQIALIKKTLGKAYQQTLPVDPKKANTGYMISRENSAIQTCIVRNVDDLIAEKNRVVEHQKLELSARTSVEGSLVTECESNISSDSNKSEYYRTAHLGVKDIIQTAGVLPGGSLLYLEKNSAGKVSNRSFSTTDPDKKINTPAFAKEDAIVAAFEHAKLALDGYHKESGAIIIRIEGTVDPKTAMDNANKLYAALLVLGKDIPYLKIKSQVAGCHGPEAAILYGNNNKAFISKHLGNDALMRKNEQKKFAGALKIIQAGKKENEFEGSRIEIKPKT